MSNRLLHPKIQELKTRVGAMPILRANRYVRESVPVLETRRTKSAPTGIDTDRVIRQYHCIFGLPDDYGTMPIRGAFKKSIKERGPGSEGRYKIPTLYCHDQKDSIGLPYTLEEDEIGLYSETEVLRGVQVAEETLIRHRAGVINNGSYGFHYIWDKMEYDEDEDVIVMKECELLEVSVLPIGSQMETYGVRSPQGIYMDETLPEDSESLIKRLPREHQLAIRSLIERHISLAKNKPLEQTTLEKRKTRNVEQVNYNFLIKNFKI